MRDSQLGLIMQIKTEVQLRVECVLHCTVVTMASVCAAFPAGTNFGRCTVSLGGNAAGTDAVSIAVRAGMIAPFIQSSGR